MTDPVSQWACERCGGPVYQGELISWMRCLDENARVFMQGICPRCNEKRSTKPQPWWPKGEPT